MPGWRSQSPSNYCQSAPSAQTPPSTKGERVDVRYRAITTHDHKSFCSTERRELRAAVGHPKLVEDRREGLQEGYHGLCSDQFGHGEVREKVYLPGPGSTCALMKRAAMGLTQSRVSRQASLSMYAWKPFQKSSRIWRPREGPSTPSSWSCKRRRRVA